MQIETLLYCSLTLFSFVRELRGVDLLHSKIVGGAKITGNWKSLVRECYCINVNDSGKRVSEIISSQGGQAARLVVYLYINTNNELFVYIPNREKQLALPDFTLDNGERLENEPDVKVNDLFDSSSSSVVIPIPGKNINIIDNIIKDVPSDGYLEHPIDIGGISILKKPKLPSNSAEQINNGLGIISGSLTVGIPDGNHIHLGNQPPVLTPKKTKSTIKDGNNFPQHSNELGIANEHPSIEIQQPLKEIDALVIPEGGNMPEISDLDGSLPLKEEEKIIKGNIPLPNQNVIIDINGNLRPNKNLYPPLEQQRPKNIDNGKILSEALSENSIDSTLVTMPNRNVIHAVKPPDQDSKLVTAGPKSQSEKLVFPDENGDPFPDEQNIEEELGFSPIQIIPNKYPITPKDLVSDKIETLDQWLVEQISLLKMQKLFMYRPMSVESLKLRIKTTLHNNGIRISSSGDSLIDSNGLALKIGDLKLRPVLLSNPKDYERLMSSTDCIIPYNLPYLEGVLLMLSYPPRVLGIIYLGDDYLQESNIYKNPCSLGLCAHKTRCTSGHCNEPASQTQTIIVQSTKSPSMLGLFKLPNTFTEKVKYKPSFVESLITRRTDNSPEKHNDNNSNQLIPDFSLLPNDPDYSITPVGKEINEQISLEDSYAVNGDGIEDVGDDDGLGIRIVGGQPATASGTPLVSKGRSGYDD